MEKAYFGPNIVTNKQKLQRIQDILALSLGAGAGIIGLESLWGFIFYVLGISLGNLSFYVVCLKGEPTNFFENPLKEIYFDSLFSSISGYVMTWCLVSALMK